MRVEADRGSGNLFGALAAAGLTTQQICSIGYFLLIAGHETTAQLIATGLYRALAKPDQWPALAGSAPAREYVRRLRQIPIAGIVIGSWPNHPSAIEVSNRAYLNSLSVPLIGTVPERAGTLDSAIFTARAPNWLTLTLA